MAYQICTDNTGSDKQLYAVVESEIALIVGMLLVPFHSMAHWLVGLLAFVVAISVGIWKEVKDSKKAGGHFCFWDMLYDIAGSTAGAILAWLNSYYATL